MAGGTEERTGAGPERLRELSTAELVRELVETGGQLVRDHLELFRAEVRTEARRSAAGAALLAVGGALAFAGLLVLCLTVVYLLSLVVPLWVAGLVVGGGVAGVGGLLAWGGTEELRKAYRGARGAGATLGGEARWTARTIRGNA